MPFFLLNLNAIILSYGPKDISYNFIAYVYNSLKNPKPHNGAMGSGLEAEMLDRFNLDRGKE